jgi:hypothetical protein
MAVTLIPAVDASTTIWNYTWLLEGGTGGDSDYTDGY